MRSMVVEETGSYSGYDAGPPWVFKGRALYQLHLVKAETARLFIPKEFRLVEAFGYTLGGLFLAHYDDSPAGRFDELVVIAGIVWNLPTSCAWAARVLVDSDEACKHGRKHIGLPSQVATFSRKIEAVSVKAGSKYNGFLNMMGLYNDFNKMKNRMVMQVKEINGPSATAFCNINLQAPVPESKVERKWMGPIVRMSLPSFSGDTEHNPHLLKYSCQIECRVRPVEPVKISEPTVLQENDYQDATSGDSGRQETGGSAEDDARNRSISVLLSKPILALEFSCMKLQVGAPSILSYRSSKKATGDS